MAIYSAAVTILLICVVVLFIFKTKKSTSDASDFSKIILGSFYNTPVDISKFNSLLLAKAFVLDIYNNSDEQIDKSKFYAAYSEALKDTAVFDIFENAKSLVSLVTFDDNEETVIKQLLKFTEKYPSVYIGVSQCINLESIKAAANSSHIDFSVYAANAAKAREIGVFGKKQLSRFEDNTKSGLDKFPVEYETKLIGCFESYNVEAASEIIKASYANAENYSQCMYVSNHLLHILYTILQKNSVTTEEIYGNNANLYRWSASTTKKNTEIQHIIDWYAQAIDYIKENIDRLNSIEYKIEKYIEENYNRDISVATMADEFNVSSQYFSRYFKTQTGNTFLDTLNKFRINKAIEFINSGDYSMTEIAEMTGFNSYKSFARNFKKYMGEIPSKFIKTS